jgi:hypothetical protein
MTQIKLPGPDDFLYISNVADSIFDDPIVSASAQEFFRAPRNRFLDRRAPPCGSGLAHAYSQPDGIFESDDVYLLPTFGTLEIRESFHMM